MNPFKYIKEQKERFESEKYNKRAAELESLKTERVKYQERAEIDKGLEKEKGLIKKAKRESFENSFLGKLSRGVKTLKQPKTGARVKTQGTGKIGFGFGQNINPAFSLGKEAPKKEKAKTITIKIEK